MAAPAVQTRGTPAGAHMPEGFRCRWTFGLLPTFAIWEFELTPPMLEGGEPIKQSTFFNLVYHTQLPQTLVKIGNIKVKGEYDPDVYKSTQAFALINRNTACTALLPNGSSLTVFGYLKSLTPGPLRDGVLPEIDAEIVVTNWDPVNRVEAGPVYTDGYTGTADG